MLEILGSFTADYLSSKEVTFAGGVAAVGVTTLQKLISRRIEAARDILLDEIRRGQRTLDILSQDDAAAVVYRYMRAAEEGAARNNLRLLAAVIVGKAAGDGLYADEFLAWADMLQGLTHDEVAVLGVVQRHRNNFVDDDPNVAGAIRFWNACKATLFDEYGMPPDRATANAFALTRTGLLMPVSGSIDEPMVPGPSSRVDELTSILVVEGLIERAPS